MERALEQNPLNVLYRLQLAISLHAAQMHEQAIAEARKTLEIDPDYWAAHAVMARSYIASEMPWKRSPPPKGLTNWRPGPPASLNSWLHWSRLGTSSAEGLVQQVKELPAYRISIHMALYHLTCSELDAAADWYQKVIEQRVPPVLSYLHYRYCTLAGQLMRMLNLS